MNTTKIKPLIQIKPATDKEPEQLSVTLLVTEDAMQSLLDQMRGHEDLRAAIITNLTDVELVLEVYRPGKSKNLRHAQNIARKGWKTLSAATL